MSDIFIFAPAQERGYNSKRCGQNKMETATQTETRASGAYKQRLFDGFDSATFDRRMAKPDTITIGELRRMDALAHFEDKQLIELIRSI